MTSTQAASKAWQEFNLEEKKKIMLQQASEIATHQDQAKPARQLLAQESKSFAKLDQQNKLSALRGLIKLYQGEIDRLTQSSLFAETAFLSIYKDLANCPDPAPHMAGVKHDENAEREVAQLKLENERLKRELQDFRKEFQEIRNQEVTIRNLEEQLRQHNSNLTQIVQHQVQIKEQEIKFQSQQTIEKLNQHAEELKSQLRDIMTQRENANNNYDIVHTKLFDLKAKYDKEVSAKQMEIDILTNELDRVNLAYQDLKEIDAKSSNLPSKSSTSSSLPSLSPSASLQVDRELQLVHKDMEISQLQESLQSLNQTMREKQELSNETITRMSQQLKTQIELKESIQNQLYAVSQQLNTANEQITTQSNQIQQRENIINNLERQNAQLQARVDALKTKVANSTFGEISSAGNDPEDSTDSVDMIAPSNLSPSERAQWDRFKSRILSLEQENRLLQQKNKSHEVQIKSLTQDNLKLYERIKYLQSYPSSSASSISSKKTDVVLPMVDASDSMSSGVEQQYKEMYENSVNPFVAFNKKEKLKQYKALNPVEKLILATTKFFLATKKTRLFLFLYMVVLHLLVFLTMWNMVHIPDTTVKPSSNTFAQHHTTGSS